MEGEKKKPDILRNVSKYMGSTLAVYYIVYDDAVLPRFQISVKIFREALLPRV